MEKKKRILLVTQNFYPENFKSNDIAFELSRRGYEIDVLTGIPNYPEGKYYKGYSLVKKRHEIVNGVHIYHTFLLPRGKGGWRLPFNYLSFMLSGCIDALFYYAWKKYDCVICHQTSPIFQVYPGLLVSRIRKIPFYMWVLDIWPDAMRSGGGINNEHLISIVDRMVTDIYKNCTKILISSKRFVQFVLPRGNFDSKIVYFPNWSDDILTMSTDYDIPNLPDGFKIMIAGNLGKAQNLDAVAEAMLKLKDTPEVKWIFIGDGSRKEWLEKFIQDNHLQENALTLGRYPFNAIPAFYEKADALLLTLRAGYPHLSMVVPARLQSYMSAGRPILAMSGVGVQELIEEADCGYAVNAGDVDKFVTLVKEKVLNDREGFKLKGKNGRKFYEDHFKKEICIDHLETIIGE